MISPPEKKKKNGARLLTRQNQSNVATKSLLNLGKEDAVPERVMESLARF